MLLSVAAQCPCPGDRWRSCVRASFRLLGTESYAVRLLQYSLLNRILHFLLFHINLHMVRDIQTVRCRRLSVILAFYLPRCLTTPYANIPITDSSG